MAGTSLCGLAILLERRRTELALHVAPRALATLIPAGNISPKLERTIFGLAFATLVTAQDQKPILLRGIARHLMSWINPGEEIA